MKRKIAKVLVTGLIGLQLIGCSNQNKENAQTPQTSQTETSQTAGISLKSIEVGDKVTLGQYKGLEVVNSVRKVSDEEVDAYINYMMSTYSDLEEITDRDVVENGDVANIDYEGKKNGVAFSGGTAQGYDLAIGSGSFIPGFEEGLIGVKKGETVDLNLTFPENYPSADLAGAEVVFSVTVNGIYRKVTAELNEEYVAGLGIEGVTTPEEYRSYVKNMLQESYSTEAEANVESQVLTMVAENATVTEVPKELVDKFYNVNISNMTYTASMYGMDLESFVSGYYGLDMAGFEAETLAAAEISAKQAFVCLKIAAEENITVSDEELNTAVEERYSQYGYASAEEFRNNIVLEEYRDSLWLDKIIDYLVENAVVSEVEELTAE